MNSANQRGAAQAAAGGDSLAGLLSVNPMQQLGHQGQSVVVLPPCDSLLAALMAGHPPHLAQATQQQQQPQSFLAPRQPIPLQSMQNNTWVQEQRVQLPPVLSPLAPQAQQAQQEGGGKAAAPRPRPASSAAKEDIMSALSWLESLDLPQSIAPSQPNAAAASRGHPGGQRQ